MENLTLSENIIAVLDSVCEKVGIAVDWTAANVMPELQRLMDCLVQFELATSIMWLCLCAAGLVAYGVLIRHVVRDFYGDEDTLFIETYSSRNELTCTGGLVMIMCGILSVILFACAVVQMIDIIKCCTFPELVVIDYITLYMGE